MLLCKYGSLCKLFSDEYQHLKEANLAEDIVPEIERNIIKPGNKPVSVWLFFLLNVYSQFLVSHEVLE